MSAPTGPVQRAAYRVWLAVGIVVLVWVLWRLLARPLTVVIPPLLLATVIVYLLAPVVAGFERRGMPRWLGTLLSYLVAVLLLSVLGAVLVPLLTQQLETFVERLPDLVAALGDDINRRLAPLGVDVPIGDAVDGAALQSNIEQALQGGALPALGGLLGGLSGLALGLLQVVLVFTLGPVVGFYVLVDLPRLRRWTRSLMPPAHRAEASEVATKLHDVVGGFIRGQLLVALFVGVAASIGLALVGLPFWLLVGVTAGLTNVIPLLGPFVAGVLGVSIALVSDGIGLAALVLLVLLVVQQLDNQLISPLVMGRNVQVHPLVVLLSLVIAGTVYGVLGLLVAVPAVAAGSVLVRHFWETRVPWAATPVDAPRHRGRASWSRVVPPSRADVRGRPEPDGPGAPDGPGPSDGPRAPDGSHEPTPPGPRAADAAVAKPGAAESRGATRKR
jgi:predicted PurR-regulated permease PerM